MFVICTKASPDIHVFEEGKRYSTSYSDGKFFVHSITFKLELDITNGTVLKNSNEQVEFQESSNDW